MNFPHPNPLPKGEGIRDATVEDADGIARVHVTAWQETYRGLMSDEFLDRLSVEQRAKRWKQTLSDPADVYHRVIVAGNDNEIVGFANYGKNRSDDAEYRGELFAIYVLKKFQGQGIGRELVKRVAQGLLAQDISSMLVWVLAKNPYRRFYESLGGVRLREQMIDFAGESLREKAYGWRDIRLLAG
jgi:GNAT superfamily N-acetyltransferase